MTVLDAFILGVIQGVAEFLPVSSSGHLVLFQNLLGFHKPMITFNVVVHLGTLLSVFIYFAKDLWMLISESFLFLIRFRSIQNREEYYHEHPYVLTSGYIILTTVVTFAVAMIFKDAFHFFFGSLKTVGIAWCLMGVLLILSCRFQTGQRRLAEMTHQDAFMIGIAQGFALIPGVSRSGMTILAGMYYGMEKKDAARYSFFVGSVAILGAGLMEAKEGVAFFQESPAPLIAGFLSAVAVGYAAIFALMKIIQRGRFFIFGIYCLLLGAFTFGYSFFQ